MLKHNVCTRLTLCQTWDVQSQRNLVWKVESRRYKAQCLHYPPAGTCHHDHTTFFLCHLVAVKISLQINNKEIIINNRQKAQLLLRYLIILHSFTQSWKLYCDIVRWVLTRYSTVTKLFNHIHTSSILNKELVQIMWNLGVRNLKAKGRCRGLELGSCTVVFIGGQFLFTCTNSLAAGYTVYL